MHTRSDTTSLCPSDTSFRSPCRSHPTSPIGSQNDVQLLSPCNDWFCLRGRWNLKRLWFCVGCSDVAYTAKWNRANSSEFVVTLVLLNRKVCAEHMLEQTWKCLGFWHLSVKCHRFYWNSGKSRATCLLWISGQKLFISSCCTFASILPFIIVVLLRMALVFLLLSLRSHHELDSLILTLVIWT